MKVLGLFPAARASLSAGLEGSLQVSSPGSSPGASALQAVASVRNPGQSCLIRCPPGCSQDSHCAVLVGDTHPHCLVGRGIPMFAEEERLTATTRGWSGVGSVLLVRKPRQ